MTFSNKFSSFIQPLRFFNNNISQRSYSYNTSISSASNNIFNKYNYSIYNNHFSFLNDSFIRTFGTSVTKTNVTHSLTNEKSTNFYAPYIYEEVKAPSGGGPVYWRVRKFIMNFKRRANLRARERRWNWDVVRAAFAGVPKLSYDPKINQWVPLMDNEEWGGVGGRFWIEFSNKIWFNLLFAYIFYYSWYRLVLNNKHNVFARWKNKDAEDDE
ncbi:conserved hypothetical protein [Theileria orientalis strain Shintoku]|uniref:Transmembrane protein n=1 Tax=Theileria orientalis strain Shintoku TaxID=869250 RepID=J4D8R7_THEOR|nr:conserved hypothetical protein [Theileria orientalis strain Shintoku]PVC54527.1 hypothetical protein MACL_00003020 [Theileria orientalis]BAM40960.1 conserved hypothetical protein [Theileria orientalis strain Shintoku]|eukprot:XP_009691261.1 conserved hypothetical protein [Theileria orientalis strain Shintoku]